MIINIERRESTWILTNLSVRFSFKVVMFAAKTCDLRTRGFLFICMKQLANVERRESIPGILANLSAKIVLRVDSHIFCSVPVPLKGT